MQIISHTEAYAACRRCVEVGRHLPSYHFSVSGSQRKIASCHPFSGQRLYLDLCCSTISCRMDVGGSDAPFQLVIFRASRREFAGRLTTLGTSTAYLESQWRRSLFSFGQRPRFTSTTFGRTWSSSFLSAWEMWVLRTLRELRRCQRWLFLA